MSQQFKEGGVGTGIDWKSWNIGASLRAQLVKNLPAMQQTWFDSWVRKIGYPIQSSWASLVAQLIKNLPAIRENWVWPGFSSVWPGEQLHGLDSPWGHKESDTTERLSLHFMGEHSRASGWAPETVVCSSFQRPWKFPEVPLAIRGSKCWGFWALITTSATALPCVRSPFSPVWLCATPWTVVHQAPLSVGFFRQNG